MFSFLTRLPARWPHTILLTLVLAWATLSLLTAPLFTVTYFGSIGGLLTIVGYVLAFVLGSWMVEQVSRRFAWRKKPERPPMFPQFTFVCATGLASLGVALRLVDRLFIRGTELSLSEI